MAALIKRDTIDEKEFVKFPGMLTHFIKMRNSASYTLKKAEKMNQNKQLLACFRNFSKNKNATLVNYHFFVPQITRQMNQHHHKLSKDKNYLIPWFFENLKCLINTKPDQGISSDTDTTVNNEHFSDVDEESSLDNNVAVANEIADEILRTMPPKSAIDEYYRGFLMY